MRRLKTFLLRAAPLALTLTLTLAVSSSALACGSHGSFGPSDWTLSRDWRTCDRSIQTFAGALEMYNLDHDTSVEVLDEAMTRTLLDEGYLASIPTCPSRLARGEVGLGYALAQQPELRAPYPEVFCLDHGFQAGIYNRTAYEQLGDIEANQHLRGRALRTKPDQGYKSWREMWQARKDRKERFWGAVVALGGGPLMALLAFLG